MGNCVNMKKEELCKSAVCKLGNDPMAIGIKNDNDKLQWSLIPWNAMEEVVKVLMHGANKYGANNWQYVDDADTRYFNAALRHVISWWHSEKALDAESGVNHLAHAVCSLLFLLSKECR